MNAVVPGGVGDETMYLIQQTELDMYKTENLFIGKLRVCRTLKFRHHPNKLDS